MHEIKLRLKILRPASGRSRAARVEPCHWSVGYVGVSLQERQATMQVMLWMSLWARWDATLVILIIIGLIYIKLYYIILKYSLKKSFLSCRGEGKQSVRGGTSLLNSLNDVLRSYNRLRHRTRTWTYIEML